MMYRLMQMIEGFFYRRELRARVRRLQRAGKVLGWPRVSDNEQENSIKQETREEIHAALMRRTRWFRPTP